MSPPELLLSLALLVACTPVARETAQPSDSSPPTASSELFLRDEQNYSYSGELDGPSSPLAELTDISLDWSALTHDIQCHELDPAQEIDNAALLIFPNMTEREVEAGLAADDIQQIELAAYLSYEPAGDTSMALSDFTFFGTEVDIQTEFTAGSGSWLVLLTSGTQVGVGARMLGFLTPTAGESATSAGISDGCAVLDFAADLSSLEPLPVLAQGPWLLDWSGLTRNGLGAELSFGEIDGLMIGRYADDSIAELEASFLDLELVADELWNFHLPGGTSVDLSTLDSDEGAFPGFQGEGSWILALRCSTCSNPAPLFLTVVEPDPAAD